MGSESGCPIEVHPIEIEKCDEMYDHECEGGKSIPFHRAGYDRNTGQSPNTPRQQVRASRDIAWRGVKLVKNTRAQRRSFCPFYRCAIFIARVFQVNRVTSWIDGSFIYSTSEAWINAMRSFKNGTLLSEPTNGFPVRNTMRVPLFNNPVPNILRTLSPERLFCKCGVVVLPPISNDGRYPRYKRFTIHSVRR